MNQRTQQPVELDLAAFGLEGNRKPIDAAATTQALVPFVNDKANLVVAPTGQVSTTDSDEFRNLPKDVQDGMTQLGTMTRSFG